MRKVLAVLLVLSLAFAVACSSSGKSPVPNPTPAQTTSAVNIGKDTASFSQIKTATDYTTPITSLSSLYSDSTSLAGTFMLPQGAALTAAYDIQATTNCATKGTDGTITYDCSYTGGGYKGTVKVSGDTITVDITISYSATSYGSYDLVYSGSITATSTSVNGKLHFETKYSGTTAGSFSYVVDLGYNNVTIDTAGCPTGGSATIDAKATASAGGQSQSFSVNLEVDYGPACGTVSILK